MNKIAKEQLLKELKSFEEEARQNDWYIDDPDEDIEVIVYHNGKCFVFFHDTEDKYQLDMVYNVRDGSPVPCELKDELFNTEDLVEFACECQGQVSIFKSFYEVSNYAE